MLKHQIIISILYIVLLIVELALILLQQFSEKHLQSAVNNQLTWGSHQVQTIVEGVILLLEEIKCKSMMLHLNQIEKCSTE